MSNKNTWIFNTPPYILNGGSVGGPLEQEGPLGDSYDMIKEKLRPLEGSWEKAEGKMQIEALGYAMEKSGLKAQNLDFLLGGDLLDQITVTNFTAKTMGIPFLGLYNACATMAEAIILGALLVDSGRADNLAVVSSSHNATAERQYRNPLELGAQRPQTAQWTVTGAGAMIISNTVGIAAITGATIGKVKDLEVKDPNQMGAAMAPAVFDSLKEHFKNTATKPDDYDLILSGDLGCHGHKILLALFQGEGFGDITHLQDAGVWIYDDSQDTHCGGSGAGCSASVWSGYLLREIMKGKYKRILLAGSGALLSPCSLQQGNTIPSISHVVELRGM